ncbi:MAG: nucleotide disphospho-sugar-binding domain-containing protein [Terracidiphilus sp.]
MPRIILITKGTAGDIEPFIELASVLRRRGNDVLLITHCHYEADCFRAGIPFVAFDRLEQFAKFVNDGHLLDTPAGIVAFSDRNIFPQITAEFLLLERYCRKPETIVIARHMASLAASFVCERYSIPIITLFTCVAQANCFQLWIETCRSVLAERINSCRMRLNFQPICDWDKWAKNSSMFVACWPEWFAQSSSTWPLNTQHLGFLYSHVPAEKLPPDAERLLQNEARPILITGGTSIWKLATNFYEVAATACKISQRPGILVCRHDRLVEKLGPEGINRFASLPFSTVMPRAVAVIHHGGSGTMIRAMASAVPQIILPFGADRQDNAIRIEELGLGIRILPPSWEALHIAQILCRIIDNDPFRVNLDRIQSRMSPAEDLERTCMLIEKLLATQKSKAIVSHY